MYEVEDLTAHTIESFDEKQDACNYYEDAKSAGHTVGIFEVLASGECRVCDSNVDESLKTIKTIKIANESGIVRVNQTVTDGTRYIAICEFTDENGNMRYVNLPLFNSIYSAQEWARRDLYQR